MEPDADNEKRELRRVLYLGTPLLAAPNRRAAKVAYLRDGATLEVLASRAGFLHVRTKRGGTGWVSADSVAEGLPG
jgi:hypothetical protein